MVIVFTKIKYCYKISSFYPSGISYWTLCHYYLNQGLVMQFTWIFLKIQYFLQNNLRKNMKKKTFLKKQEFSVKIFSQVLTYLNFFSRISLFSKVILLICSNVTTIYITVPEIWSII